MPMFGHYFRELHFSHLSHVVIIIIITTTTIIIIIIMITTVLPSQPDLFSLTFGPLTVVGSYLTR